MYPELGYDYAAPLYSSLSLVCGYIGISNGLSTISLIKEYAFSGCISNLGNYNDLALMFNVACFYGAQQGGLDYPDTLYTAGGYSNERLDTMDDTVFNGLPYSYYIDGVEVGSLQDVKTHCSTHDMYSGTGLHAITVDSPDPPEIYPSVIDPPLSPC